jgi:hypoxanthine phosphoribosyltransferase
MQSYDYAHRKGIRSISWEEFVQLAARLAEALAPTGVEIIVGIARGGLLPATVAACALRLEYYPVRITRRLNDEVRYPSPVWRVPLSPEIAGKTVTIVDEIADTGETLALVAASARELGAARVITASLVRHTWAHPVPDISILVSDELVIFPWDREVFVDGTWHPHPEMMAAIAAQQETQRTTETPDA